MPKPVVKNAAPAPADETIDVNATVTPDTVEGSENGAQTATRKERQPSLPLSPEHQKIITRTMRKMRKGEIPGGVTPSSVAAHVRTLPEFADIADRITPVKVSSTINTMRKQRESAISKGETLAAQGEEVPWLETLKANEVPEFDRQHSARLAPEEFAALLTED